MRKGPDIKKGIAVFRLDWKKGPHETLEAANKKLKVYGLEFVYHETQSDTHAFSIQPIPKKE